MGTHRGAATLIAVTRIHRTPTKAEYPISMLGYQGRWAGTVSLSDRLQWHEQTSNGIDRTARGRAYFRLGEYQLGHYYPADAIQLFDKANGLLGKKDPCRGTLAYDRALALLFSGRFEAASSGFSALLRSSYNGYDRRAAATYRRHALTCLGYHESHAKLGVPEPAYLDPLCGVSGLAVCLKAHGLRYDKDWVSSNVTHTGEGSTMADLVGACPRLGFYGEMVTARSDEALEALPKPVICHVEFDHFLCVTKANSSGVTYVCSDCGPFPGGEVRLTWTQWHALDPQAYVAVAKAGSVEALALQSLPDEFGHVHEAFGLLQQPEYTLSSPFTSVDPNACWEAAVHGPNAMPALTPLTTGPSAPSVVAVRLAGTLRRLGVASFWDLLGTPGCGERDQVLQCPPWISCPMHCPPTGQGAPDEGHPIDLARGQLEYNAPTDLTVFNPNGPSVSFQRLYVSLGDPKPCGLGLGWTTNYNMRVVLELSNGSYTNAWLVLPNNARIAISPLTPPASGSINCTLSFNNVQGGVPLSVSWAFDPSSGQSAPLNTKFLVTSKDRTVVQFQGIDFSQNSAGATFFTFVPTQIQGPTYAAGNTNDAINLSWSAGSVNMPDPDTGNDVGELLNKITDNANPNNPQLDNTLLDLDYDPTNGYLTQINEETTPTNSAPRGRTYTSHQDSTVNVPSGFPQSYWDLQQVSTLGLATKNGSTWSVQPNGPLVEYILSYSPIKNNEQQPKGIEEVPTLTEIERENPGTNTSGYAYVIIGFDQYGEIVSTTDANGNQTIVGAPTTAGPGGTTLGASQAMVTVERDPSTIAEQYVVTWDTNMSLTQKDLVTNSTSGAEITPFKVTYNGFYPHTVKDANGLIWTYGFDSFGNMTSETTPKGTLTSFTFDYTSFALGELKSAQEGSKTPTAFHYFEPTGFIKEVDYPVPGTVGTGQTEATTFTYTTAGDIQTVTTPGNNAGAALTTTYVYQNDNLPSAYASYDYSGPELRGHPVAVTDPNNNTVHLRYDGYGDTVTKLDTADGGVYYITSLVYNPAQRLTSITGPNIGSTGPNGASFYYGTYVNPYNHTQDVVWWEGPLCAVTPVNGKAGPLNQSTELLNRDAEGNVTGTYGGDLNIGYSYDASYRVKTVSDAFAHPTTYNFNPAGELTSEVYPDGATISYPGYDGVGNLTQSVDARSGVAQVTANYSYKDGDGLLSQVQYVQAQNGNKVISTVSPGYDLYDRMNSMSDDSGQQTSQFDDLDAVTNSVTTYTGQTGQTLAYGYWPDGSLKTESTSQGSFGWNYDLGGRPTSMTNPSGETTIWGYFENDWLHTQNAENSSSQTVAQATYLYNPVGELNSLTNTGGSNNTISSFSGPSGAINYDGLGNPIAVNSTITNLPSYGGNSTFAFGQFDSLNDFLNILTSSNNNRAGIPATTYHVDGDANLTTVRGSTWPSYNSRNEISSTSGFQYDGNGNPTTYGGYSASFDEEDRMTSFRSNFTAVYRADGLRAWKKSGGVQTNYIYDQFDHPVLETSNNQVTAINTFGANGLVSRRSGGASTFYTFDPFGSTSERLSGSGSVLSNHVSDEYGLVTSNPTTPPNDPFYGFGAQSGYYHDAETGFYLLGQRYYNPYYARFVNEDPIGLAGGFNLFGYVGQNPFAGADPDGLDWLEYNGQYINWWRGRFGDRSRGGIFHVPATSGSPGRQDPVWQYTAGSNTAPDSGGPAPHGNYHISLRRGPRSAPIGPHGPSYRTGITTLPQNSDGSPVYPGWGTWRAALDPDTLDQMHGRSTLYIHDSGKGYTNGCVETNHDYGDLLLAALLRYRAEGHSAIRVLVRYGPGSTHGASDLAGGPDGYERYLRQVGH